MIAMVLTETAHAWLIIACLTLLVAPRCTRHGQQRVHCMKRFLALLLAAATLTTTSCAPFKRLDAAINNAWNGLSPEAKTKILVGIEKTTLAVLIDLAGQKDAKTVLGDAGLAVLQEVKANATAQGDVAVVAISSSGQATIKSLLAKQKLKPTLSVAALAALESLAASPGVTVPAGT